MQLRQALPIAALMLLAGCTQHLQRVTADPAAADAWDNIGGDVVGQLADKLRTCDARRKACEQCLRRLDAKNVIQL